MLEDLGRPAEEIAQIIHGVFGPTLWSNSDIDDRAALIGEVFEAIKRDTLFDDVVLIPTDDARLGTARGKYIPDPPTVLLATRLLHDPNPTPAIGTLVHELRHALQYSHIHVQQVHADELWRWQGAIANVQADKGAVFGWKYNAIEVDAYRMQHRVQREYWLKEYLRRR